MSADEPTLADRMQVHVTTDLVTPLTAHDNAVSRFSRVAQPPRERRARLPQSTPSLDANGLAFLPFVLDGRVVGGTWRKSEVIGCVYPEKGDMFVQTGAAYRPATFLLGKAADPVPGVCVAVPAKA